jgi:hypothetical protein
MSPVGTEQFVIKQHDTAQFFHAGGKLLTFLL